MAALMDVADAAAKAIESWFADRELRHVGTHPGAFTDRELDRLSSATPGVYVSLLRMDANANAAQEDWTGVDPPAVDLPPFDGGPPARRDVTAHYMASVVTRPREVKAGADRIAEAIVAELLRRIPEQRWKAGAALVRESDADFALPPLGPAERVEGRNEFSPALAAKHMALWTVTWAQWVRLGEPIPNVDLPTTLCVRANGGDDEMLLMEEEA